MVSLTPRYCLSTIFQLTLMPCPKKSKKLLNQYGFEVGRYISLEKIVESRKEGYYESLRLSSQGWHTNKHDIFPWVNYLLSTILAAYKELENRVGLVTSRKGNKADRIKQFIENKIGAFTKADIRQACPDVSEATINRVLQEMRDAGDIMPSGLGRSARWRKVFIDESK